MQSFNPKRFHSFQADASALGGFLEEPFQKHIPTLTPVSLPPAGGFATARSGAFNLDEIVSCSAAYTLVTGRESKEDGSILTLATAVVEGLNILNVVTATRIVAQISVTVDPDDGSRKISLTGSAFEGLRLAGRDVRPQLNSDLQQPESDRKGSESSLTWESIRDIARPQAERLISRFKASGGDAAHQWAVSRHGWMRSSSGAERGHVLCSLVDSVETTGADDSCGHIVDIPGFGRIFLGELLISPHSVQLVSLRAELGCPIKGIISGPSPATSGGGGQGNKD